MGGWGGGAGAYVATFTKGESKNVLKYVFVSQKTEAIDCVKYTANSVVVSYSVTG